MRLGYDHRAIIPAVILWHLTCTLNSLRLDVSYFDGVKTCLGHGNPLVRVYGDSVVLRIRSLFSQVVDCRRMAHSFFVQYSNQSQATYRPQNQG
jgi:hypothetical protein